LILVIDGSSIGSWSGSHEREQYLFHVTGKKLRQLFM
jgi:hypothetical protein